jgi:hypothetical protein
VWMLNVSFLAIKSRNHLVPAIFQLIPIWRMVDNHHYVC